MVRTGRVQNDAEAVLYVHGIVLDLNRFGQGTLNQYDLARAVQAELVIAYDRVGNHHLEAIGVGSCAIENVVEDSYLPGVLNFVLKSKVIGNKRHHGGCRSLHSVIAENNVQSTK